MCSRAHAQLSGSYMAQQPTQIAFLRITQSGKLVTGYLQTVDADSQTITRPKRSEVKGTVSGNHIVLKLDSFLGHGGRDLDGEIRAGKFYLEFPVNSGRIEKVTFSRTSTDQWNRALSTFQSRWTRAVTSQRIANATAERKKWLEGENTRLYLLVSSKLRHLAWAMNLYEPVKGRVEEAEKAKQTLEQKQKDAQVEADKARQDATTPQEGAYAASLAAKVSAIQAAVTGTGVRLDGAKYQFEKLKGIIEGEKQEIAKNARTIRQLQSEMKRSKMEYDETPDLGRYLGQVIVEKAKLRDARAESSTVIAEIPKGAYVGFDGGSEYDAWIGLGSEIGRGKTGVTARINIRLVDINSLP